MAKITLIIMTIVFIICAMVGAVLWPYTINSWLTYAGREPVIVWWHGALLGFCPVIGQATIPLAVVTWIALLFLT